MARWWRAARVAEEFDVSARTIKRWVALGAPCAKPNNGMLLFDPGALDEWLRSRAGGPGPVAAQRKRGRPRKYATVGGGAK